MKIYFISGLGVDRRVFQRLILPDNLEIVHLPWITPVIGEQLPEYARRLSKEIDTKEPFAIVGLSFGGMLASEVAKYVKPEYTILISSVAARSELPFFYRMVGFVRLDMIIPSRVFNFVTPFTYWLFGAKSLAEKLLLKEIIHETDPSFLKWAIRSILSWNTNFIVPDLIRIHGTDDHIIPTPYNKKVNSIMGGGHLMVYTHATEVSETIAKNISRA